MQRYYQPKLNITRFDKEKVLTASSGNTSGDIIDNDSAGGGGLKPIPGTTSVNINDI